MRVAVDSFRGEAPRLTPRALPANAAQDATNARLMTGDLEAWRQFVLEQALENTGPVLTIHKLNDVWLSWDEDVDVARGAIAGDTTFRTFLTGPDVYDRPRWTNYAMATSGAAPYPFETRPLGVPPPDGSPSVAVGADPNPTSFSVDITDAGNELAQSWTKTPTVNNGTNGSEVRQRDDVGNPAPCYELEWQDWGDNGGLGTWMKRNFGIQACTVSAMEFDVWLNDAGGISRLFAGLQRNEVGSGISVGIQHNPDLGGTGWVIQIGSYTTWFQGQYMNVASQSPTFSGFAINTWFRARVEAIRDSAAGTTSVTFSITDPSDDTVLVTLTTLLTLDADAVGGWCGFTSGDDQRGTPGTARVDNIRVTGTGATGYSPVSTATNYVYTFVNDIGEESAPSFASTTVLRPDGVSITVTTPTDVPTGIDNSDWQVATKRIYRATTGATGTFYRFVAEIPLAQDEYVDAIADTELGEILASELWALPPVGMRGMLALPNGVMAGFSKNQLCLSAQNRPHAWPVEYRLTVDTDIVAIGAIDTTVVIATQKFIYLAVLTDPAAASMAKLEVPQSCVSKRSLAYLIGIGVVFASPDGLIAVAGNGNVRNLTSGVFTREQWQALVPESIVGVAHDDVYHFFYDDDNITPVCDLTPYVGEGLPFGAVFWDEFTGTNGEALEDHAPNLGDPWEGYGLTLLDGSAVHAESGTGPGVYAAALAGTTPLGNMRMGFVLGAFGEFAEGSDAVTYRVLAAGRVLTWEVIGGQARFSFYYNDTGTLYSDYFALPYCEWTKIEALASNGGSLEIRINDVTVQVLDASGYSFGAWSSLDISIANVPGDKLRVGELWFGDFTV